MSNLEKQKNNQWVDIIQQLKNWDFEWALQWLWEKIKTGIEYSKEFLRDLFRIAQTVKTFNPEQTNDCCWILNKFLKK